MDVALWREGQNVVFWEGGPQKRKGFATAFSFSAPAKPIRGINTLFSSAAVQRLFFGTATKLYHWDGSTLTLDPGTFTGVQDQSSVQLATTWSLAPWGNFMTATNGVDAPQRWAGSGDFGALAGVNFDTAEIFLVRGRHLLAFNTTGSDPSNGVACQKWCSADNIELWTPAPDNSARDLIIREFDSPIMAAKLVGEVIAILGTNQLAISTYIGAPSYFGTKPKLVGIGCLSKQAIAEHNNVLYGVSRNGIWMSDLVAFKYIDTPAVREYFLDNLNLAQSSKVAMWYDDKVGEVRVCFPSGSSLEPDKGVGYRPENQSWTLYTKGFTCGVAAKAFSYPVVADATKIYFDNNTVNADGSAIDAWVRTKPLDLDLPDMWKYVDVIMTQLRRMVGAVQVRIGWQQNLDDAITWEDYFTINMGYEPATFDVSGRYLTIEWRSNVVGGDFAISGFDVFGEPDGSEI